MTSILEIRSALEDLRAAYNETTNKLDEKSKKGLLIEDSDFDLVREAKGTIDTHAEDWLWQLLQEVENSQDFLRTIQKQISMMTGQDPNNLKGL